MIDVLELSNTMLWISVFFFLFLMGMILYLVGGKSEKKETMSEMRRKQSTTSIRENALKQKLEKLLEERQEVSKRVKVEEFCSQAGFNISYGEYKIISYVSGLVLPILGLLAMNSIFPLPILAIIGYFIPNQVIGFVRNRRLSVIENQVGIFMKLLIERYKTTNNIAESITKTVPDFKGQEPMVSELKRAEREIEIGKPVSDVLRDLAKRTGNKYLNRLTDYYEISLEIGTAESRELLLPQAFNQYRQDLSVKRKLRERIIGTIREVQVLLLAIPLMMVYQLFVSDTYLDFMLNTRIGQIGLTFVLAIMTVSTWFINKKIGGPID